MKRRILEVLWPPGVIVLVLIAGSALANIKPSQGGRVQTVEADTTLNIAGTWQIGGTTVTASAAEVNALASTGLSAAELGLLNGVTAGTVAASKVVTVDANLDTGSIRNLTLTGNFVTGATTLAEADLAKIDGVTDGTAAASKALVLDANSAIGTFNTTAGVGAKNGAAVTVVEKGNDAVHKTVFTLTALSVTVTDTGGANGAQGNVKIYDFPEGVLVRGGCVANATTLAGAGGIADGAAVVLALGEAAAGVGDATLSSTEADFIASFAGTLVAGAGTFAKYGEPSVTSLDGHTTPIDLILNVAVPDADVSASDTLEVTGTITCIWTSSGDF